MREDICTIPVNEILEVKDGCPICRMYDTLEQRMLEFIMGDAMMEPDVRIETNRTGFCHRHFSMMLARKNRLSLALMLETRLAFVEQELFGKESLLFKKGTAEKAEKAAGSCYVCSRIDSALDKLLDTFFKLWKKEPEFRESVAAQPVICLPHTILLLKKSQSALDKKAYAEFENVLKQVVRSGLKNLNDDVSGFCKMFDYRNNGLSFGDKKDAPDRAIAFLTGVKKP